jgi:hypothetical protein
MDGGSVAQLSGTIATDRHGRRECQTIVWNNRGRPTSNAAGVAEIVADNFRHSRHPRRSDDTAPECIVYFDPGPERGRGEPFRLV